LSIPDKSKHIQTLAQQSLSLNLLAMKHFIFLVFAGLSLLTVLESCVYVESEDDIPPRGESTRTYDFRNFDELEMGDAFHVDVVAGSSFAVSATGELNDLDDLEIFVEDGKLVARYEKPWRNSRKRMDIEITMPDVEAVEFSGAVNARIEGFENLPEVEFDMSGASKCNFIGSGREFKFDLSGASQLNLEGAGKYLDGDVSGASQLNAFDLKVEESDLKVSGASNAKICVSGLLKVDASGASNVRYKGNPTVDKKVSGGSSVRAD
jgi:cytoskeletal protein CcmA (bactofilin family)